MDAQFWDDRYGSRAQLFSGDPNGVLVTELADLPPGQALDAGCGEGGDALWLARRAGWSQPSTSPRSPWNARPPPEPTSRDGCRGNTAT